MKNCLRLMAIISLRGCVKAFSRNYGRKTTVVCFLVSTPIGRRNQSETRESHAARDLRAAHGVHVARRQYPRSVEIDRTSEDWVAEWLSSERSHDDVWIALVGPRRYIHEVSVKAFSGDAAP